jgi:simple sugar transport system permease protein
MSDALSGFLEATVRTATPLAFAALGECLTERAGIINVGLEGSIIAGAFGGLVAASALGVGAGFVAAAVAGGAMAAVFALCVVYLETDQIITGTAITLLGLGMTGALYRTLYGVTGAALHVPTIGPLAIPGLSALPIIGRAAFAQPASTYVAIGLVPLLWWWLYLTHAGLALRAIGEAPEAATTAGIGTRRLRFLAVMAGGAMAGLAGATLVLAQVGTFAEGMSAGRGFMAIAIVVLGRWHPVGTAIAALLFGAAWALQFLFQAMEWALPYQLFLALPYLLTLAALAVAGRRSAAPAALGRRERSER